MADAQRYWHVKRAKQALASMSEGNLKDEPWYFDRMMAGFGLTPEDIGSSPEEVEAAKRCWRVAWARHVLKSLPEGTVAYAPEHFDRMMAEFGLTPEDIGSSAEEVEAAKRQWHIAPVKLVLAAMPEGNRTDEPRFFDWLMAELGLAPEDIDATAEQIESAKAAWAANRAR